MLYRRKLTSRFVLPIVGAVTNRAVRLFVSRWALLPNSLCCHYVAGVMHRTQGATGCSSRVAVEAGTETVPAVARFAEGVERERIWAEEIALVPKFAESKQVVPRTAECRRELPATADPKWNDHRLRGVRGYVVNLPRWPRPTFSTPAAV